MLENVEIRRFDRLRLSDEMENMPVATRWSSSPFRILDIQGLGPVKSDISTSPQALIPGTRFLSTTTGERNLVFRIELLPDLASGKTMQEVRDTLYSLMPPREHVNFTFGFTDRRPFGAHGWVESNEPVIFSKNPEVQVSVICPDPFFAMDVITQEWSQITNPLEILYNEIQSVGFVLDARVTSNIESLEIHKQGYSRPMIINGLQSGDRFTLSTIPGEKYLNLNRGGVTGDAFTMIGDRLVWHNLHRGDQNIFSFSSSSLSDVTLRYTPLTIGI